MKRVEFNLVRMMMVVSLIAAVAAAAPSEPTLDELLNLAPSEKKARPAEERPAVQAPDPAALDPRIDPRLAPRLNPRLDERLSDDEVSDLFDQAVAQMDAAARRLAVDRDPGLRTQRTQQQVLAKLDQLIAETSRSSNRSGSNSSCSNCAGSGCDQCSEKSGSQGSAANARQGKQGAAQSGQENQGGFSPGSAAGGDASSSMLEETRREWGNLPARLRDELLQGLAEPFSPVYRSLTEAYYRRLAEEGSK